MNPIKLCCGPSNYVYKGSDRDGSSTMTSYHCVWTMFPNIMFLVVHIYASYTADNIITVKEWSGDATTYIQFVVYNDDISKII